jgi:hypothetical protein
MAQKSRKQSDKAREKAVDYARSLIEARIPAGPRPLLPDGLPPRSPDDLLALARAQGVKPVTDPERLLGDFWPEDEDVDDFLEARRQWQLPPDDDPILHLPE